VTVNAVLVEDEPDQARRSMELIGNNGFSVQHFSTFESVQIALAAGQISSETELFVLDRKLPENATDEARTEVGDALRELVLESFPDALVIVLSGFSDHEHVLQTLQSRGQLDAHLDHPAFDRVRVFKKRDLPEVGTYLGTISSWLQTVDDVELIVTDLERPLRPAEARIIKKLALNMRGVSLRAESLTGGLSGDLVFKVQVKNVLGIQTGSVLAKLGKKRPLTVPSGLEANLPTPNVASRTSTIKGVCDGLYLSTYQLAVGASSESLFSLISSDDAQATQVIQLTTGILDQVLEVNSIRTPFSRLVAPLISWPKAEGAASVLGISLPAPTSWFPEVAAFQHGDLHAGNILIVDGAPFLIDFDSQTMGSRLLDPLTLLLGAFFHPDSCYSQSGFVGEDIEALLRGERLSDFPGAVAEAAIWLRSRVDEERELWGLVLGYSLRNAGFEEIRANAEAMTRLRHLARVAVAEINV
jgi:CheY-like chemotaxis protein